MKRETRNEVDFFEIFEFAEKQFGISWNTCNDIFFRDGILTYKSHNDIYRSELNYSLEEISDEKDKKPYEVLAAFMDQHNIGEMRVFNG